MRSLNHVYLDITDRIETSPEGSLTVHDNMHLAGPLWLVFPANLGDRIEVLDRIIECLQTVRSAAVLRAVVAPSLSEREHADLVASARPWRPQLYDSKPDIDAVEDALDAADLAE
jgi:hypothetical protein